MKSFTLICLTVAASFAAGADTAKVEFEGGSNKVDIPAGFDDHSPTIHVTIQGISRPLRFAVDTGASFNLIDSRLAAQLGLKPNEEISTSGAGSGQIKMKVAKNLTFHLRGLTLQHFDVLITDLSGIEGRTIDGILGYDFFNNLVVMMDEDRRSLTVMDPSAFDYRGSGVVLPVTFGGGRGKWIYVPGTVKVDGVAPETLQFFVDTGSSDAVDTEVIKKSKARLAEARTGVGLGQSNTGVSGRVEWFKLGEFELRNAPSVCCGNPGNENMIGCAVLHRFVVTFDYARKRMILEKGKHFADPF